MAFIKDVVCNQGRAARHEGLELAMIFRRDAFPTENEGANELVSIPQTISKLKEELKIYRETSMKVWKSFPSLLFSLQVFLSS